MDPIILTSLIAFPLGMMVGAILYRLVHSESAKNRRLELQVDQLQDQHTRYQAEVSAHFSRTADMLGKLNSHYRDIFNHLAVGAEMLGSEADFKSIVRKPGSNQILAGSNLSQSKGSEIMTDPPRDYAPKRAPTEKGTLSEDFGFHSENPEATTAEIKLSSS